METLWTHTDALGGSLDLDRRNADDENPPWTLWTFPEDGGVCDVWLNRPALLALYHAIGDELRATGGCDLPAEPVT